MGWGVGGRGPSAAQMAAAKKDVSFPEKKENLGLGQGRAGPWPGLGLAQAWLGLHNVKKALATQRFGATGKAAQNAL